MNNSKPILGEDTIFGRLYYQDADYASLEAECERMRSDNAKFQHMLADITVRHFAGNIEDSKAQRRMDEYLSEGIRLLEQERDQLRAEAEGLREDAERYRYLRNTEKWPEAVDYAVEDGSPGQMDVAIDAALAAEQEQPQ